MTDLRLRDVTFSNEGVRLVGTLALPPAATAVSAAVVMVGGSGPSDRHNDTLFPPIREYLVRSGIAALSYDKRGGRCLDRLLAGLHSGRPCR